MEKLKIDYSQEIAPIAFLGEKRFESLYPSFADSLTKHQGNLTKAVEECVYAYSDSVEDTIGITMTLSSLFVKVAENARNRRRNPIQQILFDILKEQSESETMSKEETDAKAKDSAQLMSEENLKDYLAHARCKDCEENGHCVIQEVAKARGLSW